MRHRSTLRIVRLALVALFVIATFGCHTAPEAEPEKPTWALGSTYRYDLHMTTDATTDPSSSRSMFDYELHAQLALTPVEVTTDGARVTFELTNVDIKTHQDGANQARFANVVKQLQIPTLVTYEKGRQATQNLPKDAEAVTVGILRNLSAQFQLPVGANTLKQKLETTEYDATGLYQVEYTLKSKSGVAGEESFGRKKTSYKEIIAADLARKQLGDNSVNAPKFVESTGEIVRKDGVFTKLRSHERLDLELMAGKGLTTRTTIEMDLSATEPAHKLDVATLLTATLALPAKQAYVHSSSAFDMDAAKIGGRSFDEVISMLESLGDQQERVKLAKASNGKVEAPADVKEAEKWAQGSLQHFIALSAMLRKYPEDITRAVALIRGRSPATPSIISALGAAGTGPSQAALLEIMRDEKFFTQEARDSAGFTLLRTKTPTRESALALQAMLSETKWREHAVFGLGTFVRRFGEMQQPEPMKEFGDVLIGELAKSTDNAARIEVLTGLSNSGYVPALEPIRADLKSKDELVRAAAVQAIRLMRQPEVDGMIIAGMTDATSKIVRVNALEALENRDYSPELASALSKCLRADPEPDVRLQALQRMVSWSAGEPSLRPVIEQTAQKDESDVIRRSAQDALAQLTKP